MDGTIPNPLIYGVEDNVPRDGNLEDLLRGDFVAAQIGSFDYKLMPDFESSTINILIENNLSFSSLAVSPEVREYADPLTDLLTGTPYPGLRSSWSESTGDGLRPMGTTKAIFVITVPIDYDKLGK